MCFGSLKKNIVALLAISIWHCHSGLTHRRVAAQMKPKEGYFSSQYIYTYFKWLEIYFLVVMGNMVDHSFRVYRGDEVKSARRSIHGLPMFNGCFAKPIFGKLKSFNQNLIYCGETKIIIPAELRIFVFL